MPDSSGISADHDLEQVRAGLGDEFEVMRSLGAGTTAQVYLAREKALGRLVAIKVLARARASDETARKRFEREARAAASLSEHPDVVAVHRFGRLPDDTPYLVMRYVKGRTMDERLAAEGQLPVDQARAVLRAVAAALAAAHQLGIVHRDVRPGNVLWDDDEGRGYLSDFGIAAVLQTSAMESARLTQTGIRVGDPRYLSPEQLQDEELTEQADIYGLGILGYELFSGQGPYAVQGQVGWINAHLSGEPRDLRQLRPDVPEDVADLLSRCLAKQPNHRPRAADVVRLLSDASGRGVGRAHGERSGLPADDENDVAELIKRRVPQIVGFAIVLGAGLIGLMSSLYERYELPRWVFDVSIATAVAGLLASTVIAWFHGERGTQKAPRIEFVLLGLVVALWLVASVVLILAGG